MSCQTRILSLALLVSFSVPALAGAEESPRDRADLERAAQLRHQSAEERAKIDVDRVRGDAECRRKILENRCLNALKDSLIRRENAVRADENEAAQLERGVKARAVAEREAAREADRPLRDAQQAEQARQFRIEQDQKHVERQARSSDSEARTERADDQQDQRAARALADDRRHRREAEEAAARARRARADEARYAEKQKKHDERQRKADAKAAAKAASEAVAKAAASVPRH